MGISDLFNKNKPAAEPEETAFEKLFKQATTDPTVRKDFYRQLLTEDLIVIIPKQDHIPEGRQVPGAGTHMNVVALNDGKVPVFTSLARIYDKDIIKQKVHYASAKGAYLFGLMKEATIVLNPYSDYGKELLPAEIRQLLDGTLFHTMTQGITMQQKTTIKIGQPAVYPDDMVAALRELFASEPAVEAVYLAWMMDPATGAPPHYVIGVQATGDTQEISNKTGTLAQQFLKPDEFVDIVKVEAQGGFSTYFSTIAPFYKKPQEA